MKGRGAGRTRLLLLCNGTKEQGTARLFLALADRWRAQGHDVDLVLRDLPRGVSAKLRALVVTELRNISRLRKADVLVVHTALSLSLVAILVARLMRRPVIAFVWDLYPASTRIAGNIRNPLLLAIYGALEQAATRSATRILIPSEDYRPFLPYGRRRADVYPMWPTGPVAAETPRPEWPVSNLSVAFAGQINGIRGVDVAVREMLRVVPEDVGVELHLYSSDPTPAVLDLFAEQDRRLSVTHHGYVGAPELASALSTHHLGLVSLDPAFHLPAFPSKIAAYLSAGLPVFYVGRRMPALEHVLRDTGTGCVAADGPMTHTALTQLFERYPDSRQAHLNDLDEQWGHVDRLL